jgi:hypothetical protein
VKRRTNRTKWLVGLTSAIVVIVLLSILYLRSLRVVGLVPNELGESRMETGQEQEFALILPESLSLAEPRAAYIELRYPDVVVSNPSECRAKGRCRITVKDGDTLLACVEEDLRDNCDYIGVGGNGQARWSCLGRLTLDVSNTRLAQPVAGHKYFVNFEWIELPEGVDRAVLVWVYRAWIRPPRLF